MSRRRPAEPPADSLELLLDTICNTFGGVLFIALLVAVLTSAASVRPAVPDEATQATRAAELARRVEALQEELAELRRQRSQSRELRMALGADELGPLVRRLAELEGEWPAAEQEVLETARANVDLLERVRQREREAEELLRQRETVRSEQAEAETAWDRARRRQVSPLAMPVAGNRPDMDEIQFILSGGRAYLWHEYDTFGRRTGLNRRDLVVVRETADKIYALPHPLRGIPLGDSQECRAALSRLVTGFTPTRCYLACVVRPDSYAHARFFRNFAVGAGFAYRILPAGDDSVHVDRGGESRGVQ